MRVEIRNNSVFLDGYVNVVQRDSRMLPSAKGKFIEQIEARTFEKALSRTENVDLLFNHKQERRLGSIAEGNLELTEDSIGLRAKCTVTDEEIVNKAKNGELKGWSFGFICREDKWVEGEIQRRYISDLDLLEVSILDMTPAYVATSIESRGEDTVITEQRFEEVEMKVEDDQEDEVRNEPIDYSPFEREIEILKIKGGLHK